MRAWAWSLGALLLGLLLSLAAAWLHHRYLARAQHLQHQRAAERSFEAIEAQLRVSGLLVRSVQALFLASDGVHQTEFASYYASLQPRDLFPSLQALAYARKSERDGRTQFLTTMVAPLRGNERVLGLDVASQPANLPTCKACWLRATLMSPRCRRPLPWSSVAVFAAPRTAL